MGSFRHQRTVWESTLPPHLKLVALALLSFADADGRNIYPSVSRVAGMVGKSARAVQTDIGALLSAGLFVLESRGGGRAKTARYRFAKDEVDFEVSTKNSEVDFGVSDTEPRTGAWKTRKSGAERVKPTAKKGEARFTRSIHDQITDQIKTKERTPVARLRNSAMDDERFSQFWTAYPRKVDKPEARKAWAKLTVTDALFDRIVQALEWQCQQPGWLEQGGKFVPYPASWLRGERWEDEPFRAPLYAPSANTKAGRTMAAGIRIQAALDAGAELDPFGTKLLARAGAAVETLGLGGWTAECDREHGGINGSACGNQHMHFAKMTANSKEAATA